VHCNQRFCIAESRGGITHVMKLARFICTVLALLLVTGCIVVINRCIPLSVSEGWSEIWGQDRRDLDQQLRDDYNKYISELPKSDQNQLTESSIRFFKNRRNGERAVFFETDRRAVVGANITYSHLLIYDKNGERIKAMKYKSGKSLS
jgi:hypothetical protein